MVTVECGATADELQSLYREYNWWADRDAETIRRALRNTDETVLLREDGDPEPFSWMVHRRDEE